MPRFRYKSVTPAGEIAEGEMDALDSTDVIEHLHSEGHTPIRAQQVQGTVASQSGLNRLFAFRHLSPSDVVVVSQEMATMLRAGLTLDRALAILGSLAESAAKRDFINGVLESVRSGATLADALERRPEALPSFYVGMVRAGEARGDLAPVLARLAEILSRTQAVRENVKSAMFYPIIVLVVACVSIGILVTVVVPEFRPLFESSGAALPQSTRIIIGLGEVLKDYWLAIVAAFVGLAMVARWLYRQPVGRMHWDSLVLRLPLVGDAIRKTEVARFTRTLGTLLSSGVVELNALSIAANTLTNRMMVGRVSNLTGRLRKGDGWAVPLQEAGVFPGLAVQMVQVGEESGQLDAMLIQVADIYDEEVRRTLQRLLSLLAPMITIGLGLVVAVIIGSMLTAILSAYNLPI